MRRPQLVRNMNVSVLAASFMCSAIFDTVLAVLPHYGSRVQPYRTPSDNFLAFLSSLALVPIFLGSLGLQTKALGLSIDSVFLVAVLFAFSLLVLGAALLFFVAELHGAAEILLVQATRQPTQQEARAGEVNFLLPPLQREALQQKVRLSVMARLPRIPPFLPHT